MFFTEVIQSRDPDGNQVLLVQAQFRVKQQMQRTNAKAAKK